MVQFNLLPDVKIEFIKTRYRKRLIIFVSIIASAACFAIFMILFLFVRVNQKQQIKSIDKDIKSNLSKIQSVQDLDKILTIQNQLNTLPDLHSKKPVASRLVDILNKVTPNQVTISDISLDYTTNKMSIKGNAADLITVNKFVDTLKFTKYTVNDSTAKTDLAFHKVVLSNFSLPSKQGGAAADTKSTYQLDFEFDPVIFAQVKEDKTNGTEPVSLTVPAITSTRSETEKPTLFSGQPATEQNKQGGR